MTGGVEAYKQVDKETGDPRKMERQIIRRVTKNLERAWFEACRQTPSSESDAAYTADLAAALEENRRLWYELTLHLGDENNELPQEARADLISLASFTEQRTNAIADGEVHVRDGVQALLDINNQIIAGLEGKTETESA